MKNDNFTGAGKFADGNEVGRGRPKGSKNRYTLIKEEILEVWGEEGGKEKFRQLFNGVHSDFLKALDVIVRLLPKHIKLEEKDTPPHKIMIIRSAKGDIESE